MCELWYVGQLATPRRYSQSMRSGSKPMLISCSLLDMVVVVVLRRKGGTIEKDGLV